ncbi:hypothetical protein BLA29_012477, partial [Euroglyphus maynei]
MDLSVANINNGQNQHQSSSSSSSSSSTTTSLESHSRHIKKVLKHYQAAATLSLNGPDWFLPIVSPFGTSTNGNNSSAADNALELTKTSNCNLNVDKKIAGNVFTTLDLRTTSATNSTTTITSKQAPSPYLSVGQSA